MNPEKYFIGLSANDERMRFSEKGDGFPRIHHQRKRRTNMRFLKWNRSKILLFREGEFTRFAQPIWSKTLACGLLLNIFALFIANSCNSHFFVFVCSCSITVFEQAMVLDIKQIRNTSM